MKDREGMEVGVCFSETDVSCVFPGVIYRVLEGDGAKKKKKERERDDGYSPGLVTNIKSIHKSF